jgi:hypothetical protein
MFMALPEASATLRCGFQLVRFTDNICFTVEGAADHDSKFPRARPAHARGFGFQFFEVEVRIRRAPHPFIVLTWGS